MGSSMSVHCEEEAVVEVEAPEEEEAVAAVEVSCVHMPPRGRKGREQREVGKGRGGTEREGPLRQAARRGRASGRFAFGGSVNSRTPAS